MVPHSWIKLFGVAENIKTLIVNSMKKWKMMWCTCYSELGEVDIKLSIFQDSSS